MAKIKSPENIKELPRAIVTQMVVLSTAGFGFVVALAWNEFIKSGVEVYIRPYLGQGSGVFSLFIYAVVVTVIAVLVTMQLTKIQRRLEKEEEIIDEKIEQLEKKSKKKK